MQELQPSEMYGIARKFNDQLMAYPVQTHSAIIEMVRIGRDHRNLMEQKAAADAENALRQRAVTVQEQNTKLAQEEMDRRRAAEMRGHVAGPELVQPAAVSQGDGAGELETVHEDELEDSGVGKTAE
jgi:hypothetical protein